MENQRSLLCLLVVIIFFFVSAPPVLGELLPIVDDQDGSNSTTIQTYIVHVREPEGVELLGAEELESWHRSFLPNTTLDSGEPRLVYSYRHAIGGFAARLTREELRAMEAMDGFLLAMADDMVVGQTTYTPQFLGMDQWQSLWTDTSQGEGMIIGVIDNGVIPTHPSFRDDGLPPPPNKWKGRCDLVAPDVCNNKIIGATAFRSGKRPSPIDNHGHGVHTASIAAGTPVYDAEVLGQARGLASGIAPRAHLATYRVLFNNLGNRSDYLAGVDQAINDGVDVISMSLGFPPEHMFSSSLAIGSFRAIQKGIFPSLAAMNNGPANSVITNDFPWGLTVGASTIDRRIRATVVLGNKMEFDGESAYQPDPYNPTQLPLVYPGGTQTQPGMSCQSMAGLDVKGKMVLCGTGVISNEEKSPVVKAAGGAAMLLMNNPERGSTTSADAQVIPAINVKFPDALKIMSYFKTSTNPTAAIVFKGTKFGALPSPSVATFSNRGPSRNNGGIIKPDIIGPGVNILAAWAFEVGPDPTGTKTSTFSFQSGTSMATPHLSGVAALLMKNHPSWSPAMIKSAIMTTAYVLDRDSNPITDEADKYKPATVFAMGAGHVNPSAANDPGLVYDLQPEDYARYLCGMYNNIEPLVQIITRNKSLQCAIVGQISAEKLNYPSIAVSLRSTPTTTITRTVTNVGNAEETYSLRLDEPEEVTMKVSPDKLEFSKLEETKQFTVEFSIKGNPSKKGIEFSQGSLSWVSDNHVVRSPIAVHFK